MKLRKVLWVDTVLEGYDKNFLATKEENKPKQPKTGWFHEWAQTGDEDGCMEKYALVEDEGGLIHEIQTHRIKFIDKRKSHNHN